MRRLLFVLSAVFVLSFNSFGMSSNSSPFIVILSPRHNAVLCEGRSYLIKWKSRNVKKLCIEPVIGGHPAGILGNCNVDALKGEFLWHIPKGFVSNFGVNNEKVKLYLCNKSETYCASIDVVIKSICINPIRRKPKPL
ncbi:hypothetical protein [Hippea alviniae]|uniref:hypothetical protein n=1 Tax=Hippea alviniae TaxID=1279027 RepID=UPI0003B3EFDF|nr:hypothetical protein [Hippea alviniae]